VRRSLRQFVLFGSVSVFLDLDGLHISHQNYLAGDEVHACLRFGTVLLYGVMGGMDGKHVGVEMAD